MTHLTLEQCKKLKEIGFPQDTDFSYDWKESEDDKEGSSVPLWGVIYGRSETSEYACPTLEELIEWLGQEFVSIHRMVASYIAYGLNLNDLDGYGASGKSSLEAVYNLALAIKSPTNDQP